jgi:MSHA type pilus biogenesis protein MshL
MINTQHSRLLVITLLTGVFLLSSCTSRTTGTNVPSAPAAEPQATTADAARHASPAMEQTPEELLDTPFFKDLIEENEGAETRKPEPPKFKEISPLKTERISISLVDEGYREIYQLLSRAAGLNLVLAPQLESLLSGRTLTAEFQENSLETVLDTVSAILDISWREENSTLFIEPYVNKTFHLDFILSTNTSKFEVGGDVLGSTSSDENVQSPLTGSFKVAGDIGANVTDIYSNIEQTIGQLVQQDGEFMLNRQTGTVLVHTRPQRLKLIAGYIDNLRRKYTRQVLIEAQIMEVTLNKSKNLGIDWQQLILQASEVSLPTGIADEIVTLTGTTEGSDSMYSLAIQADKYSLTGVFRALRSYGEIKMLSNPRIKTMNGQSAMISVGQSVSYLKSLEEERDNNDDGSSDITITTEIGSIFDGILLGVTPVIKDDDSVSLHIVPIKSEIESLDQQQLGEGSYTITFPTVNLREISTVVDVKPNTLVMLGGLIQDKESDVTTEVPILADIPFIGKLFQQKSTSTEKVEMVIILKLKVLD